MIIERLRTRGIGPFKELVDIPVYELPPGLTALVGNNGAGKTTILSLLFEGTLYRWLSAYMAAVQAHVNRGEREAMSELTWRMDSGSRYRSLLQCDPHYGGAGKTEHYLHELVGESAIPLGGPRLKEYDEALARILPPLDFMTASVFAPAGGEGSILSRSPAERKSFFMRMTGNDQLELFSLKAREKWREIEPKLLALQEKLPELTARAARRGELHEREAALKLELEAAQADVESAKKDLADLEKKEREEADKVSHAHAAWERDIELRKAAIKQHGELETELRALRDAYLAKKKLEEAAVEAERKLATKGPGGVEALEQEVARARLAAEAETEQWSNMVSITKRGKELKVTVDRLKDKSKNLCDICPLGEELRIADTALQETRDQFRTFPKDLSARPKQVALQNLEAKLVKAKAEDKELDSLRLLVLQKGQIKQEIDTLAEQGRLKKARIEALVIPTVSETPPPSSQALATATDVVRLARQTLETTQEAYKASLSEMGSIMGALREVGDPDKALAEAQELADRATLETVDWKMVERSCGRNGAQALVIDSMGQEVTAIINELLVSAWDSRFQVQIETLAAKADGGQKEVFDIQLLDTEAGVVRRQGSTGQMVIIDTAVRLGMSIYNTRKSNVPLRTLFLDEAVGALSQENANRYISMLRRGMAIGGFHRCFFVSHHEDVWSQADSRLFVRDGQVLMEA